MKSAFRIFYKIFVIKKPRGFVFWISLEFEVTLFLKVY